MKTVKELIEVLEKVEDKNMLVMLMRCDCEGPWNGNIERLDTYQEGPVLLLKRDEY